MDELLRWFFGLVAAVLMAIVGWLVKEMRQLAERMGDGHDKLHERINRVREEYVRRDDLDGHLQRIDGNVNELRREIADSHRDVTKRLDAIVERLPGKR